MVLTANQLINISSLPALTGVARDFYISEKADSTNLRFVTSRTNNTNFSINSLPEPGAAIPPSHNTTAEELIRVAMSLATNSQDVFSVWPASSAVILNDIYLPTAANGHRYKVTTAGTTGTTEPSWPTTAGGTVSSGTAVFTEDGSTVLQQAGLTRANIKKNTFKWPLGSKQSSVNQVKGNFRDSKNDFALTPFKYNDKDHQALVKKTYSLEIDLSAVDSVHQVARIAGWTLSKNREGDWFDALETGPAGLVLEEGDVICASDDSGGLINVATRIEDLRIKPNHDVAINQARKYSTLMFSDEVAAHRIPLASSLRYVQTKNSIIKFMDLPPIRDEDALVAGFYVAVSHDLSAEGDWRGWALYADYGDGYTQISEGDIPATIGTATTTLAAVSDPSVWDRANSVTFTLYYVDPMNPPTSVTEAELLSNARRNLFAIGGEYVQAATVTDNGNRSFTISTLLRGRFGADTPTQLTHGPSEQVVYLNGAEKLVQINPVRLNGAFNYKAVTTNQDVSDTSPVSFTWTGGTIKPLAPVNLRGARDSGGDLLIQWDRRSRTAGGLTSLTDVPLSEEKERYQVEIYSGSILKRTMSVVTGMQMAAFLITENGDFDGVTHNSFSNFNKLVGARSIQEIPAPDNFLEGNLEIGQQGGLGLSAMALQTASGPWYGFAAALPIIRLSFGSATIPALADLPYFTALVTTGSGLGPFFQLFLVYEYGSLIFQASSNPSHGSYDPDFGWLDLNSGLGFMRVRFNFVGSSVRLSKAHTSSVPFSHVVTGNQPLQFPYFLVALANDGPAFRVSNATMTTNPQPGTVYSAAQQSSPDDFGSPQPSIKVRVSQFSSVIGYGSYVEKDI